METFKRKRVGQTAVSDNQSSSVTLKFVILLSVSLYVRNVVFLSFCNEKVSFIVFHMACQVTLTASDCLIE